jgi:hypothetical protein
MFEGKKLKVEQEVRELWLREDLIRRHVIDFKAKLKREANLIISNHEAQFNERNDRLQKAPVIKFAATINQAFTLWWGLTM